MCQPGRPRPPRRVPGGVLAGLRRLPEREVAGILLQRVPLLLFHLVGTLARQAPVLGIAGDPEVDVSAHRVGVVALDQLLDERDDAGHVLRRLRQLVGEAEAEIADVLEVPLARPRRELGACSGGRVVDLVVHVRDVVDERRVVAALPEPRAQPHADDERPRVADVRPLVDGRPAEVHPHGPGRRRQLLELSRQRAVEAHD